MGPVIQKADPGERRTVLAHLGIAAVVGALLIALYEFLMGWAAGDPGAAVGRLNIVIGSLYILALPMILICRYLWRVGSRIVAARRYPPPGMKVIRDAIVTSGPRAAMHGRLLRYLAVFLGIVSLTLPIVLPDYLRV